MYFNNWVMINNYFCYTFEHKLYYLLFPLDNPWKLIGL